MLETLWRSFFFAVLLVALSGCFHSDEDDRSSSDDDSDPPEDFVPDDDAPVIDAMQSFRVSESAGTGTFIGTVTATDPDQPVSYSTLRLSTPGYVADSASAIVRGVYTGNGSNTYNRWFIESGDSGGRLEIAFNLDTPADFSDWRITSGNGDRVFAIGAKSGILEVADPRMLDAGTTPRYRLGITVSDGEHTSGEAFVDIDVTAVPQGPAGFETDRVTNRGVEHVIHISVDGLHPAAITTLGAAKLPGFYRLRQNGSFTDNARADANLTYTLPNHMSQLTGRPALGAQGHHWWFPVDLFEYEVDMHDLKGSYVSGIFDVVHDFGLKTAMYTSKPKFVLFDDGWDGSSGAIDRIWPDSGRDKLDRYVFDASTGNLVDKLLADLAAEQYHYAFLHLKDPDSAGHEQTWSLIPGSKYLDAVEDVDALLVRILDFIDGDANFAGSTVLILTADHGGEFGTFGHQISRDDGELESGVVPFYVYGGPVPAAENLYSWNPASTFDPGAAHPFDDDLLQPIRNSDAPNLALEFLGLPNVSGSTVDNLGFPYF